MVLRSFFTAIIFLMIMNKDIKYYMYTDIPKRQITNLISRVCLHIFYVASLYTSIKYFPLVFVALISSLGPLLTAVFSYFMLKYGLTKVDTFILLISFIGILVLISGS